MVISMVLVIVLFQISDLSWFATQALPALWMVMIALSVPLAFFLLFGQSWKSVLAGAVVSVVMLTVSRFGRERRQLMPERIDPNVNRVYWGGFGYDQVGMGPKSVGKDGFSDAVFVLRLDKKQSPIKSIYIRRVGRTGKETGQIWTTEPHGRIWPIGVVTESLERLNPARSSTLNLQTTYPQTVYLHVSDVNAMPSGWFQPGQRYQIELNFVDSPQQLMDCVIP
jgi:hypothetical protein